MDRDSLEFTETTGMSRHEKIMEQHKRAARRNFLASRDEQEKIRERYKPANLHGVIKINREIEKSKPFDEGYFKLKIRECVNRLHIREKGD